MGRGLGSPGQTRGDLEDGETGIGRALHLGVAQVREPCLPGLGTEPQRIASLGPAPAVPALPGPSQVRRRHAARNEPLGDGRLEPQTGLLR